jgi:hypothetical protein
VRQKHAGRLNIGSGSEENGHIRPVGVFDTAAKDHEAFFRSRGKFCFNSLAAQNMVMFGDYHIAQMNFCT